MQIAFSKYQGTGNDFIIINNSEKQFPLEDVELIAHLCHRRFGIGADGLMLVVPEESYAFRMVYFNSDGRPSTMCGNGGRCIAAFAHSSGQAPEAGIFLAVDGPHPYEILANGTVRLKMIDVNGFTMQGDDYILQTGSPHYVRFADQIDELDLVTEARLVRYSDKFAREGINVNFVEISEDKCSMRTYERGVEDETYSCGTGTVAAALSIAIRNKMNSGPVMLHTIGGVLKVDFKLDQGVYTNVWLEGPAVHVFDGKVEI
jgi:diaminopimelate epimerase